MFESKLDAMVREKVERIVNAMPDASGGRDRQRRQIRAHWGAEGIQGRPLRTQAHSQGRQTRFEGAQAQRRGLRIRRHQTLPAARAERRGIPDRHTRQVDDISQLLWGERMPSQTLSDKLKKVYGDIDSWRTRPLEGECPYVFVDGVWHKRSWGGHVENVSVLVAIGVDSEGHREVIGVAAEMEARRLKAAANCLREGSARRPVPAAGVPGRSPQAHPHERHDRTAQPRDQAVHARRGKLPGREQHAHARVRPHQVRHRQQLVRPALHGYVPAR